MNTDDLLALADKGYPISGENLDAIEWHDLDVSESKFVECTFRGSYFSETQFSDCEFTNCRFINCNFSHASLMSAFFDKCFLGKENEVDNGCRFSFCEMKGVRLANSNLSFCVFERSNLFNIEAERCNLLGTSFIKTDFYQLLNSKKGSIIHSRAQFKECNFELANLCSLKLGDAEFLECRMREADLTGVDFTDASLRGCDLFQAITNGAKFEGADLRGAEISGFNLLHLNGFHGMRIDYKQQFALLEGIGVEVHLD